MGSSVNIATMPCDNILSSGKTKESAAGLGPAGWRPASSMDALLRQARGDEPADLVLKNCRVVNIFSAEILEQDIAVTGDRIAGLGSYQGQREIDCEGRYACPGFIDGHVHVESSMLTPPRFCEAVLPHGTTAVICDPHEIANVAGVAGVQYMLAASEGLDLGFYFMAPSCVPATAFETAGAALNDVDIARLLGHPQVIGLAEMMNFPGAVAGAPEILAKLARARAVGYPIDGHAPGLTGKELQAYVAAGIDSDHECTRQDEALEKLRAGMYIYIRQGSTARNLEALLPLITPETIHRCLLVTDDRHPGDLMDHGHMDDVLRQAVALGLDPLLALRMVTLNPARRFGLRDRGALAPGYRADVLLVDDLREWRIADILVGGRPPRPTDQALDDHANRSAAIFQSMQVRWSGLDLRIPAEAGRIRAIGMIPGQLLTDERLLTPTLQEGLALADPGRDLCKLAVIERHHGTGRHGVGFVQGLGLTRGALASSVAHDSHNLIVAGMTDTEMLRAARIVAANGGGMAVVDGDHEAILPLPVAGLMSDLPLSRLRPALDELLTAAARIRHRDDNPFMSMGFLALPVIPSLKMTDQGLFDVRRFCHVRLWSNE